MTRCARCNRPIAATLSQRSLCPSCKRQTGRDLAAFADPLLAEAKAKAQMGTRPKIRI